MIPDSLDIQRLNKIMHLSIVETQILFEFDF